MGRAGIEFEALLGCEYLGTEKWRYEHVNRKGRYGRLKKKWEQMEKMIQEMPQDWKFNVENDDDQEEMKVAIHDSRRETKVEDDAVRRRAPKQYLRKDYFE